jgi:D-amino acid aminotransferase
VKYCILNSQIIETNKAKASLKDLGMLRGYGVFDFLRTYNKKPFLLDQHLNRLIHSAKTLNIEVPYSKKEIGEQIQKLLDAHPKLDEANIRIVLTGGDPENGQRHTFYILLEPITIYPQEIYEKGIKLMTHEYQRHFSKAKSLNYSKAYSLKAEKEAKKAFEILYIKDGQVLECSTSNIFIFKNGKLITPKDNILLGTTRNFIIQLAQKHWTIEERSITADELLQADEVFISATNKEIMPVVKIEEETIANGKPGPETRKLMEMFRAETKI